MEIYQSGELTAVALLRRDPQLDLGMMPFARGAGWVAYQRDQNIYCFSGATMTVEPDQDHETRFMRFMKAKFPKLYAADGYDDDGNVPPVPGEPGPALGGENPDEARDEAIFSYIRGHEGCTYERAVEAIDAFWPTNYDSHTVRLNPSDGGRLNLDLRGAAARGRTTPPPRRTSRNAKAWPSKSPCTAACRWPRLSHFGRPINDLGLIVATRDERTNDAVAIQPAGAPAGQKELCRSRRQDF